MSVHYLIGLSTASRIIFETCQAIWNILWTLVLPTTFTEGMWLDIAQEFEDMWNFPHCIGAIDGKHILMQRPSNAGSSYFNYKGTNSIVLLAVCDAQYVFKLVDIGAYGRDSDGGIFRQSIFGQKFENAEMNLQLPSKISKEGTDFSFCIIGDEAFPLKSYMLRPYPRKQSAEYLLRIYNYRLSRARRTIENSFGILASRWRIFRKPIIAPMKNVVKIVQATVCLHNWIRLADINNNDDKHFYVPEEFVDREHENGFTPGTWSLEGQYAGALGKLRRRIGNNGNTREAADIREIFISYFNNEGAVPWQDSCI